jgi:hypothetical protein
MIDDVPAGATESAPEKLLRFEDETADPRVVQFAHYLGTRISAGAIPLGFAAETIAAAYDLGKGTNGYTDEAIEHPLVGIDHETQTLLARNAPRLAAVAFSDEFADEVRASLQRAGILLTEQTEETGPDTGEIITEPIDTIDDAYDKLVLDARERVVRMEWSHFGVTPDQSSDVLERHLLPLSLRTAPYYMAINALIDEPNYDAGYIREIFPHQKKLMHDNLVLAMVSDTIVPEMAMLIRDHMFLAGIDSVAMMNNLDPVDVVKYFGRDENGMLRRAAARLHATVSAHPDLLK